MYITTFKLSTYGIEYKSELPQKAQVVFKQQTNIGDAVFFHGQPFDAKAERIAGRPCLFSCKIFTEFLKKNASLGNLYSKYNYT